MSTITPDKPTMVTPPRRILIAEDDERTRQNLQRLLTQEGGVSVDVAKDGHEARKALIEASPPYSLFLTDLQMPGPDGMELIQEVQKLDLPTTVIVMTAFGSIADAVKAMQIGAANFLTKPIDPDHLQLVIDRAIQERGLLDEVLSLRQQMQEQYSFQNIISKSPQMLGIFELIQNVAHTTTSVLIEGATGTGKEMIAKAIHQASAHIRPGPFVAVNCAALPENLLESELFGHE